MTMIKPSLTLYDIFGPGYIYNTKASYHNRKWLSDEVSQNSATGFLLSVAGEMPIICHRHVTEPSCIRLLQQVGLQVANNQNIYHDQNSYYDLLDKYNGNHEKIVVNYPHLPEEINKETYSVDPNLLVYLNNKKNLDEIVPHENLPRRKVLSSSDFLQNKNLPFNLPFVVKAATNEPSGGGFEVVICKNTKNLQYAKELFKSCDFVVVEEFIAIKENYCVQFVQTYKNRLIYIGSAEQIISEDGKYKGNWITKENQPPNKVVEIGKQIMEKAVSLGYWGIAGIDIVIGEDNQIYVIDLNFRMNGSTVPLLLKESIMDCLNVSTLKLKVFKTVTDFPLFNQYVHTLLKQGKIILLSVYKPVEIVPENPLILICLLAGNSRSEVIRIEQEIEESLE